MTRRLLATSAILLALGACAKPGGGSADANATAGDVNAQSPVTPGTEVATTQGTGSAASNGAYGPGLVATPAFVKDAAIGDLYEIQASRLALTKAHSPAIKAFAKEMIAAHTDTTAKLKKAVADGKVDAQPPADLDERHAKLLADLRAAKPDKFDSLYLDQQEQVHREALGLLNSYATHGDNAALQGFAEEVKPHVQQHLEKASALDHSGADDAAKKDKAG